MLDPRGSNRLLTALRTRDYDLLAPHMKPVDLAAGQVLFEPGDEVDVTVFPCAQTLASLRVVTRSGRDIEAAAVGREGALGGIVSAGHKPAFGRAVVQVAGPAIFIPTTRLDAAKTGSAHVADLFSRYADALIAQLMQTIACTALHTVEQRCGRWLLFAHDRSMDDTVPLTQDALAELLGVQRTTVNAVIGQFEARGLVRRRRARVQIVDRRGLEVCACECHAAVEAHLHRVMPMASLLAAS